jgi:hypothetical protein
LLRRDFHLFVKVKPGDDLAIDHRHDPVQRDILIFLSIVLRRNGRKRDAYDQCEGKKGMNSHIPNDSRSMYPREASTKASLAMRIKKRERD